MTTASLIAARLRQRVTPRTVAQHRFSGDVYSGLQVTLRIDREDYVLSLTRHGEKPSERETREWRRAFGLDDGAEGEIEEMEGGYWVRRFRWPMATQAEMRI